MSGHREKKTFLAVIFVKHRNVLAGVGCGLFLLGLAEQDGQHLSGMTHAFCPALRQGMGWPPCPVFLMVPYTHGLFEVCLGSCLGSI